MKNALAVLTLAFSLVAPLFAQPLQLRELKAPPMSAIDPHIAAQTGQIAVDALPDIRKQAEAGDAAACFKLGLAYTAAIGVAKDDAQALAWIGKAATGGNADG
ncbi:MAG: hypothetical protein LBV49_12735, partial [Azonexus sp.]|nr:hypothetical protein [Azonexus sp.]